MAIEQYPLHDAAAAGDAARLSELLAASGGGAAREIERMTPDGYTALMLAVMSPRAEAGVVEMLIAHGAAIHRAPGNALTPGTDSLTLALQGGDVRKVSALVRAGADLRRTGGYTTLLTGLHGRDIRRDPGLLELVKYLVERQVDVDYESSYRETALRVLEESVGDEFDVVTVSFDPRETPVLALGKKKAYLDRYKRPEAEAGWHFLTGEQASIERLAHSIAASPARNGGFSSTNTRRSIPCSTRNAAAARNESTVIRLFRRASVGA